MIGTDTLAEMLVQEYLIFKTKSPFVRVADMTDREQAGMWIRIYGARALVEYDAAMESLPRNPWPGARSLIEHACRELSPSP